MSNLSQDQIEKRAAIQKSATVWGVIVGGIVGLLAVWMLGGQAGAVRFGGAIVVALGVGYLVFRASFKSAAKSALCESCGAAFSRSRSDHVETLTASEAKEEREEQPDKSIKVTTWTEDSFDVLDTYTCAKCADTSTKSYQTTRRRDENSIVQPFEPPKAAAKPKKTAAKPTKAAAKSKRDAPSTAKDQNPGGAPKKGRAKSNKK